MAVETAESVEIAVILEIAVMFEMAVTCTVECDGLSYTTLKVYYRDSSDGLSQHWFLYK